MSDVEKILKLVRAQMAKQTITEQLTAPTALSKALGLGGSQGPANYPKSKPAPPLSKKHSLPGSVKCEVTSSPVLDVKTFHLSWSVTDEEAVEMGLTADWLEKAAAYMQAVVQQEFARLLHSKTLSNSFAHTHSSGAQLPVSAITSALQTKAWEPGGDGAEAPQAAPPPPQTEQE